MLCVALRAWIHGCQTPRLSDGLMQQWFRMQPEGESPCQGKDRIVLWAAKSAQAPVAQLDRASVFGTEDTNSQPLASPRTYDERPDGACHSLCQTLAEKAPREGELQRLIDAWPTLPEPVKAGILAMVEAARPDSG